MQLSEDEQPPFLIIKDSLGIRNYPQRASVCDLHQAYYLDE